MRIAETRDVAAPVVVPAIAAGAAAMRAQFGPGVSIAVVAAIALAPVWWPTLRSYRLARLAVWLGIAAAAWGAVLTAFDVRRESSINLLASQSLTLLAMVGGIGLLLWARSCIGSAWTLVAFGVGGLANLVITGGNPVNLWKYSLAVPVTLIALGLALHYGARFSEIAVLVVIGLISAVSDSRSMTSFLLLSAALVVWQYRPPRNSGRARTWQTIAGLAILGLAAFNLFQALLLDGVLGDAAQQRTQAQLDTSGSLIAGGRPEMGAAAALITQRPWGYGSGTMPRSMDVWVAKTGMSELNYNTTNNGYVDRFMFGGHFEVHSVIGDLWILFGPFGAALAILIAVYGVYSAARRISLRTASGALILLALLGVWDTFFSPFLTSYRTLALLFALAAIPIAREAARPRPQPRRILQRR